ncbi:MAG TPA: serine/threonine-protein phosphatase [Deltaproteobacteria bacterium]|nr:serine/threonine-protein phosphatase [Deltaproteobacteria bacterium]
MDEPKLRTHAQTDRGLLHDRNEDSWAVIDTEEGGRLLVVCDGMGGMGRGDEASRLAVDSLVEAMTSLSEGSPTERMGIAIQAADVQVRDELCEDAGSQPGSTVVMVYVCGGAAHVAWAGDSRAYLVRDGAIVDRTRDHKLVEDLIDTGQLSREEARHSSLAHVVTRALGGRPSTEPAVRAATLGYPWKLMHGDRVLVCSDGLSDLVEDTEIPELVEAGSPEEVTAALVDLANARGGHDNITCIMAIWDGPSWEEDDVATPVMASSRLDIPDVRGHSAPDPSPVAADPAEISARRDRWETPDHPTHRSSGDDLTDELQLEEPQPDVLALLRGQLPWWIATSTALLCALLCTLLALI